MASTTRFHPRSLRSIYSRMKIELRERLKQAEFPTLHLGGFLPTPDPQLIQDEGRRLIAKSDLQLVQCLNPACPNHGQVILVLDGQPLLDMGQVQTKAEAYAHLRQFRAKGGRPQVQFLQAIRDAAWLSGPMPSAVALPGTTKASGPLVAVPMDVAVIHKLRSSSSAADDRRQLLEHRRLLGR